MTYIVMANIVMAYMVMADGDEEVGYGDRRARRGYGVELEVQQRRVSQDATHGLARPDWVYIVMADKACIVMACIVMALRDLIGSI